MRVLSKKPVRGRKTLICNGDEALVRRISSKSRYDGMVERIQPIGKNHFFFDFDLLTSRNPTHPLKCVYDGFSFHPSGLAYHLVKFFSLAYAHCMLPRNFPTPLEMRVYMDSKGMHAATYTEHVPDEDGAIERRRAASERYYSIIDGDKKESIKRKADEEEIRRNPAILDIQRRALEYGITISHPEANYHMRRGEPVFFEVSALDIHHAVMRLNPDSKYAIDILSVLYASCLKCIAWEGPKDRTYDFRVINIDDICRLVRSIFSNPQVASKFISSQERAIHRGFPIWMVESRIEGINDIDKSNPENWILHLRNVVPSLKSTCKFDIDFKLIFSQYERSHITWYPHRPQLKNNPPESNL
jgi:hypothetical protein